MFSEKIFSLDDKEKAFNLLCDEVLNFKIEDDIISTENPIKNLFLAQNMHFQIANGGVLQFVDNGSGAFFHETQTALKEMECLHVYEILEKVASLFPHSEIPKDSGDRRELIDNLFYDEDKAEKDLEENEIFWENLDESYYENKIKFYTAVLEYARKQ